MLKVFEAFSGIGCQRMALRNIGIEHEVVGISEIDKFAIKSYTAVHGETKNFGDISKIETSELPDFDLFTYSFPCQDISIAGSQASLEEGTGTRSSLLWECCKMIESKKPKYLLMENVKNLVGKKHKPHFDKFLEYLEGQGYTNHWEVLNAKHYGVPQNRERVFVVSVLDGEPYEFPKKMGMDSKLIVLLDADAEEKYFLKEELVERFKNSTLRKKGVYDILGTTVGEGKGTNSRHWVHDTNKVMSCLSATDYKQPKQIKVNRIGGVFDKEKRTHQAGSVYGKEGLSPTLGTMQGGWRQSLVIEDVRVRKLKPVECWRLMGCSDDDFYKAEEVNSNSQLYKQAGNGIVVSVLEKIFKNLFKNKNNGD